MQLAAVNWQNVNHSGSFQGRTMDMILATQWLNMNNNPRMKWSRHVKRSTATKWRYMNNHSRSGWTEKPNILIPEGGQ